MSEDKFCGESVRKLFVGGLDRSVTDEGLKEHFEKYGEISDCTVIKDSENNSKGYGFVTYATIDAVDECLRSRPHTIGSKEAQVKHSIPRDDDSATAGVKTNKIFIGGVKNNTEEEIKQFFENPAFRLKIKSVEVKKDRETNVNRGFGFITLETDDMADKVHIVRRIEEKKWDVMKAEPQGGGGSGGGPRGRGPPMHQRGGRGGGRGGGRRFEGRGGGGYGGGGYGGGSYGGGYGGGYDGYGGGYDHYYDYGGGYGSGGGYGGGYGGYGGYDGYHGPSGPPEGGRGRRRAGPY